MFFISYFTIARAVALAHDAYINNVQSYINFPKNKKLFRKT